jgi:hypothetical protein
MVEDHHCTFKEQGYTSSWTPSCTFHDPTLDANDTNAHCKYHAHTITTTNPKNNKNALPIRHISTHRIIIIIALMLLLHPRPAYYYTLLPIVPAKHSQLLFMSLPLSLILARRTTTNKNHIHSTRRRYYHYHNKQGTLFLLLAFSFSFARIATIGPWLLLLWVDCRFSRGRAVVLSTTGAVVSPRFALCSSCFELMVASAVGAPSLHQQQRAFCRCRAFRQLSSS